VYLKENGISIEYLIVHKGLPSDLYDASCDGVWLLRKDCHSERVFDADRDNNYANSDIHSYLNNDFIALFDSKVQNIIKQVKIPYRNSSGVISGENGLSTKVFLLGGNEVGFTRSNNSSLPIDGAKLNYFDDGTDASANAKRIAYLDGTSVYWWTRSSHITNGQYVFDVSTSGKVAGEYVYNNDAVRPALILPFDVLVDGNFNILV
jgi:hypothetical protein